MNKAMNQILIIVNIQTYIYTSWNAFIIRNMYNPAYCITGYAINNTFQNTKLLKDNLIIFQMLKREVEKKFDLYYFSYDKNTDKIKEYTKYTQILELKISNIQNYILYLNIYKNINI